MILINLLPEEYQKRRRTPIKMLGAVAGAVAINATLVAWWCWLTFGVAQVVETKHNLRQEEMDSVGPQVSHYQALEKENRQYISREATLEGITHNRVSWTRKIDELVDLINRGGGGEKYLIWMDNMDIKIEDRDKAKGKNKANFGRLTAQAHSGSGNFAQLANFLDDVEDSPFITDFLPPAPPEGKQSKTDLTLSPSQYWDFKLQVELKSPDDRAAAGSADTNTEQSK